MNPYVIRPNLSGQWIIVPRGSSTPLFLIETEQDLDAFKRALEREGERSKSKRAYKVPRELAVVPRRQSLESQPMAA